MLFCIAAQVRRDSLTKDGCFSVQVPDDDRAVELATEHVVARVAGAFTDEWVLPGALVWCASLVALIADYFGEGG